MVPVHPSFCSNPGITTKGQMGKGWDGGCWQADHGIEGIAHLVLWQCVCVRALRWPEVELPRHHLCPQPLPDQGPLRHRDVQGPQSLGARISRV